MTANIKKLSVCLLILFAFCSILRAAEQDNWYLAKEWKVDNHVNGMFWHVDQSAGGGVLFCATDRGIKAYDLNGTIIHSFGAGYFYDVVVDADGVVYASHENGVTAFSEGPGRITSVTVDHSGSRYREWTNGDHPSEQDSKNGYWHTPVYLDLQGSGSGAKAYVLMERNESLSGDYVWYAESVVVEDGGNGFVGEVNATILTNDGFSYKEIQFNSDAPIYEPSASYSAGDVVRGHYSTSYSAYNLLYEFTANDISKINNDWIEASSYVEGDIVRILDGESAAWYRRTDVVDEIDPDYNENPSVSSTQWEGIGLDNIDSLAQTGYFDLVDVTQSLGYDHAEFSVTTGNGYSQSWNVGNLHGIRDLVLHPKSAKLLIVDEYEDKICFLDLEGNLLDEEFGSYGDAPGQFYDIYEIGILPDSRIIVSDNNRLNWFDENGSFLKRTDYWNNHRYNFSVSPIGNILATYDWDRLQLLNPDGSSLSETFHFEGLDGEAPRTFIGESQVAYFGNYDGANFIRVINRAYRTKGLPMPNNLPEPSILSVSQRDDTNIVDIQFTIIDSDDENATVGILAAEDGNFENPNAWIVPNSLVDGSENKLGVAIATNQTHTISWDIGQDWENLTGNLKFKIICQDARRSSPVDVHFLKLPLEDGNLTISRSPINDRDIQSYFRFLLGSLEEGVALNDSSVVDLDGTVLLDASGQSTEAGRNHFIDAVGQRWASYLEVWSAKQGAVSGSVESREARNPIVPRNLPLAVNEYGFDVGNHGNRAWWIVKESTFETISFSSQILDYNQSNTQFGTNLALSDSYVVVGARSNEWDSLKEVFVYEIDPTTNELSHDPIIVEPSDKDSDSSNGFGKNVVISGDWLVVGAPEASNHQVGEHENINEWRYRSGAVYVFNLSSGVAVQTARYSPAKSDVYLGRSLDVDGVWVLAGAPNDNIDGEWGRGSVTLLKIDSDGSLSVVEELLDADGEYDDNFGAVVKISEGRIVISSPRASSTSLEGSVHSNGGKIFLYSLSDDGTVESQGFVQNEDSGNYWNFGSVMDYSDGILVVGHNNEVHVYEIDAEGTATRTNSLRSISDDTNFGQSLALDQNSLIVSQPGSYSYNFGYYTNTPAFLHFYDLDENGVMVLRDVRELVGFSDYQQPSLSISGRNITYGNPYYDGFNENGEYLYNVGKVHFLTSEQ